jgi:hypothetical protein
LSYPSARLAEGERERIESEAELLGRAELAGLDGAGRQLLADPRQLATPLPSSARCARAGNASMIR